MEPIPFADFVGALRAQLKLVRGARDPDLPIEVGPVTVEFTLLTGQEGEGKAGIKFWVVDAGGAGVDAEGHDAADPTGCRRWTPAGARRGTTATAAGSFEPGCGFARRRRTALR